MRFLRVQFQKIGFCKVHEQNVILKRLARHETIPITAVWQYESQIEKVASHVRGVGIPCPQVEQEQVDNFHNEN